MITIRSLLLMSALIVSLPAAADVWKWVDAKGNTHFVDTDLPIYTWLDQSGNVHYADTPGDDSAVSVQLVWVSKGTLDEVKKAEEESSGEGFAFPGETEEERAERQAAEAYYCKRAQEVYDSYLNAPQLYRTDDDGTRVYLSEEETNQTLEDTKARVDELCN